MDTVSEMIQTIIYTIYVNVKVIILLAIGKLACSIHVYLIINNAIKNVMINFNY